jgi:phage tail sheath gpL-like
MTIAFNDISPSFRASKNFIEFAGVKKSLASLFIPPTGLIIGMYDTAKTTVVNYVPVQVTSADHVGQIAGFGSHAHRQALKFPPAVFLQGGGVWWLPIPQATGTPATANVTFTGDASSAGTWALLVGGERVEFGVTNGMTDDLQAAAFVAAMAAKPELAVSGVATLNVVAVTCKFDGTPGNQIKIVINPNGEADSEKNPGTTTAAVSTGDGYLASGATDPDIEDAFFNASGVDVLGDRWYTAFTMPFVDATSIGYYKNLADQRSDPAVNRMFGAYMGYIKSTYAQALALPATVNDKFIGQIWENRYQGPDFELSAELVGIILDEQNKAPNRPYKTVALSGSFNGATVNRRYVENDALFRAGISYCEIIGSNLQLGDIALTYRTNPSGGAATDWYDAVSLHRRQAKAYSIEQLFKDVKYQRSVVVDDSAVTKVDFAVAPKDVISALTKLVDDLWVPYAWTKNGEEVIASITAEISSGYESRMNAQITDDEAQALRQIALKYAFLY